MCLINDYSLIADLHIFVNVSAECTTISLECTKVKLIRLNNFDRFFQYCNSNIGLFYICFTYSYHSFNFAIAIDAALLVTTMAITKV